MLCSSKGAFGVFSYTVIICRRVTLCCIYCGDAAARGRDGADLVSVALEKDDDTKEQDKNRGRRSKALIE